MSNIFYNSLQLRKLLNGHYILENMLFPFVYHFYQTDSPVGYEQRWLKLAIIML